MKRLPRVAILADYAEEGWFSMDLIAESLVTALNRQGAVQAELIRPAMPRPFEAAIGRRGRNLDRLGGRFWHYPRQMARLVPDFDVFHITDHSYSQLALELPAQRCLITCHDLDTFRCLLPAQETDPAKLAYGLQGEERPFWFRQMTERILRGLRQAARVTCVSQATAESLRLTGWVAQDRVRVIPPGISPEFLARAPEAAARWLEEWLRQHGLDQAELLLHVGSTIARKRIEDLLEILREVAQQRPQVRLIRVGGKLTAAQEARAESLGVRHLIFPAPFLSREQLRAVYERAALVLLPSSYEGFGLPLAEALASSAVVLASDLPVLREVGGQGAYFQPAGAVGPWAKEIHRLLMIRQDHPETWKAMRAQSEASVYHLRWESTASELAIQYQYLQGLMS